MEVSAFVNLQAERVESRCDDRQASTPACVEVDRLEN